jgi:hypothetical protein
MFKVEVCAVGVWFHKQVNHRLTSCFGTRSGIQALYIDINLFVHFIAVCFKFNILYLLQLQCAILNVCLETILKTYFFGRDKVDSCFM